MYIGLFLLLFITSNEGFDFGKKINENILPSSNDSLAETCRQPLGIERGHFPETAFQASSARGKSSLAAQTRFVSPENQMNERIDVLWHQNSK